MRVVRILVASLAGLFLFDGLVFHSGLYLLAANPDSSVGYLETFLHNEHVRQGSGPDQVLAVGDSRMMFFTRYANELIAETGYTYASIATAGTTPRCWYYAIRDVDPAKKRYGAILIPVDDYDDGEVQEDLADRLLDLHYLVGVLKLTDIPEFAGSYHTAQNRIEAARGILLKGLVYKPDFEDFLVHPIARVQAALLSRKDSASWFYSYIGPSKTMEGVSVDWVNKTISVPPGFTQDQKNEFFVRFLMANPAYAGRKSAYMKYWLGKICDYYQGTNTRIVFFRIPRGPFIRPDQPAFNPHSAVRELASRPNVIVSPEHFFDYMEKPALFMDQMHLNWPGAMEFTHALAKQVGQLLGPPRSAGN